MVERNTVRPRRRLQSPHIADHPVEADGEQPLVLPVLLLHVDEQRRGLLWRQKNALLHACNSPP